MKIKNHSRSYFKSSNALFHLIFWFLVTLVFTIVFGRSWKSWTQSFYFVSLLLPVVLGTSYFFNFFLVPRFLLKRKYLWFALYFLYTLVVSLYLEMLVLTFSFMYLVNFEIFRMPPNLRDTLLLAVVLYLVVFSGSFLLMVQQVLNNHRELEGMKEEKSKLENPFLELMSNRKSVRVFYDEIDYIESWKDYIKLHSADKRQITSKVKISVLEEKLPDFFIRIHRSFIVNRKKVTGFNNNEVEIGEIVLPIGRSYKQQGLLKLKTGYSSIHI